MNAANVPTTVKRDSGHESAHDFGLLRNNLSSFTMQSLSFALFCCILALSTQISAYDGQQSIEHVAAEIADPRSPRFRQHLSAREATELAKQLPEISFSSRSSTTSFRRTDGVFALPSVASKEDIGELSRRDSCGANDLVTPTCVRQLYNINYTPEPSRVTFAVYATEGASFNQQDVSTFLQQYRPEAIGAAYQVVGTGNPAISPSIEAQFEVALDTQTLLGTAWPAQGILYNLGGVFGPDPGQPYQPFVDFMYALISNETIPSVVSFSQSMPEDQVDAEYAKTLCTMMALVGARGVSLLFSSGNNGANGDTSGGIHKAVFEPEFPASCPWVTAIGGTTNLEDETAATTSTIPAFAATFYTASGGGFSDLFPAPDYQEDAVAEYIRAHVPASYNNVSGFNAQGRGIPDLSAFSTNMPTVVNGATLPLAGTSSSTPLWAAVIALLNDYEASQGRPVLGFLNPWLYSLQKHSGSSAAYKDITTGGNNKGNCNFLQGCNLTQTLGYDVADGWDPVTGLGSPLFEGLLQALDAMAPECLE